VFHIFHDFIFNLGGLFRNKNPGFRDFELADLKLMRFTIYMYELKLLTIIL